MDFGYSIPLALLRKMEYNSICCLVMLIRYCGNSIGGKCHMSRRTFQKRIYSLILIYIGIILFILSDHLYIDRWSEIIMEIGKLCIFIAILLMFYNTLCMKIDSIHDNISNMNNIGIEQIIPADAQNFSYLENVLRRSNNIKMVINRYGLTDRFYYLLNSLLENNTIKFQILILGHSKEHKTELFIEELCKNQKENVNVRISEDSQTDNLIIFDGKSCIMHYNNFDRKLMFLIVLHAASEGSQKNRKSFEKLWDEGMLFTDREEGI